MDDVRRLNHAAREELHGLRYFVPDLTVAPTPAPTAPHLDTALGVNRWVVSPEGMPSVWGNRAMVMLSATPQVGDAPVSLNFYQNMGALGTGASASLAAGLRGGLDFFGGQQFLGGAGTVIVGEPNDRMGLGGALIAMGDHRLEVLGPGAPSDPPDSVWVRWSQHRGPGVALDPQRFAMPFGLGGKAVVTRNDRVEYTACIARSRLQELVRQHPLHPHPLLALPCRIAVAAGLRSAPLALPNIADPLGLASNTPALGVGETLIHRTTGNQSYALAPTLLGARLVGCRNTMQEREVHVQRLDEHQVRMVSSPRQTVAWSGSADVLLVAEAYRSQSRAHAEHQTFVLDLREAPAQAVYKQLLDGEVQSADMPAQRGVTAVRREEATVRSSRQGVGTPRWPVIPAGLRVAGYGDQSQPFHEHHAVLAHGKEHGTLSTGIEQERHRGVGGIQKMRLEAVTHTLPQGAPDSLAARQRMGFRVQLSCDKVGPTAVARLQETLGTALLAPPPGPSTARRHDTYDVVLQHAVDYSELAAASEHTIDTVANLSHIPATTLHALVGALRDQPEADARSTVLRQFVEAHGLGGAAALGRLQHPTGELWTTQVHSSAWEQPPKRLHELLVLQGWAQAFQPASAAEAPLADVVRAAAAERPLSTPARAEFVRLHAQLQRAQRVAQEDPGLASLAPQQRSLLLAQLQAHLEVTEAAITAPNGPQSRRDD